MPNTQLLKPREAARALGISYPTLKQWIYHGKLRTVKTRGGHHRVLAGEIDRWVPREKESRSLRRSLRRISGRNQLVGRVVDVAIDGLLAQVKLSIGGQRITSIITAEACRELNLQKGEKAAALIKATEVMVIRV